MTQIFRNTKLFEPFTDLQIIHIYSAVSRDVSLGLYYYIHDNVEEPVYEHVTLTMLLAVRACMYDKIIS